MGILSGFTVAFTPDTLLRIARLAAVAPVFEAYYLTAMNACVNKVADEARKNATANVRTGTLRRGIQGHVRSPWLGEVGVTNVVPYAHRREVGFSGQTDALGRYYPYDPGTFYLERGLRTSEPFIAAAFAGATTAGIRTLVI
jgi:Bacteriophage HK97-gp10, putative tail-component